ncbi:hypothetical protein Hanom_Chr07g00581281 [Helianthus anomalus]
MCCHTVSWKFYWWDTVILVKIVGEGQVGLLQPTKATSSQLTAFIKTFIIHINNCFN